MSTNRQVLVTVPFVTTSVSQSSHFPKFNPYQYLKGYVIKGKTIPIRLYSLLTFVFLTWLCEKWLAFEASLKWSLEGQFLASLRFLHSLTWMHQQTLFVVVLFKVFLNPYSDFHLSSFFSSDARTSKRLTPFSTDLSFSHVFFLMCTIFDKVLNSL